MHVPSATFPSLTDQETTAVEHTELARLEFTDAQIDRLLQLRAVYPLVEFVDSRDELMRMTFLKWLYVKRTRASSERRTEV